MLRLVVLISGAGSNLLSLLEACENDGCPATVVAVGADRQAEGLAHATGRGIPTFIVDWNSYADREAWGDALGQSIRAFSPDLIVHSGFMRIVPPRVVQEFSPTMINTHPAYLPEFPGAHAVRDALASGATRTGASIIVVDSGIDSGPVIAQQRVPVLEGDTEGSLHDRIKGVERELLVRAIHDIANGTIILEELA